MYTGENRRLQQMSGIAGIWNRNGEPVALALLESINQTLAHRGRDGQYAWSQGAVGLAYQQLRVLPEAATEAQPFVHPSGAITLFDGRLDNREELLSKVGGVSLSATSPDCEIVAASYCRFGQAFAEQLNGDFALAIFDTNEEKLVLCRDAVGMRPLYYYGSGDLFIFASEIKGILCHPGVRTRPDDDVLAKDLIGSAWDPPLERTLFEGVLAIPAGHILSVTADTSSLRQYWEFDPSAKLRLKNTDEYVEAFRFHFDQAVRRRLRSAYPVAVGVSGGLDSTPIFCTALQQLKQGTAPCPDVTGFTYSTEDGSPSDEMDYVRAIEEMWGIEIRREPMVFGFLENSRLETWLLESPSISLTWALEQSHLSTVRNSGARVALTGIFGDQTMVPWRYFFDLFDHLALVRFWRFFREFLRWNTDSVPGWRSAFARHFFRKLTPRFLLSVYRRARTRAALNAAQSWYTPDFLASLQDREPRPLPDEVARASHKNRAMYQFLRCRRTAASIDSMSNIYGSYGLEFRLPFLDRDLLGFVMATPGDVLLANGVPRALIRNAMSGLVPAKVLARRDKGDASSNVVTNVAKEIPQLSNPVAFTAAVKRGYLDGNLVRQRMQSLTHLFATPYVGEEALLARLSAGREVGNVIGLELWLQTFLCKVSESRLTD